MEKGWEEGKATYKGCLVVFYQTSSQRVMQLDTSEGEGAGILTLPLPHHWLKAALGGC